MSRLYVDEILPNMGSSVIISQGGNSFPLLSTYVGEIKNFRTRRDVSIAFPFFLLSNPDQTLSESIYPDYVPYLRNIKVETPITTQVGTVSGTPSNTTSLSFTSTPSQTLTAGTLIYIHNALASGQTGQFRIVVSGSGTGPYTLDEAITSTNTTPVSVINNSSYLSSFAGTWSSRTFTLTDSAAARILMESLNEDYLYNGGVITNWMTLRCAGTDVAVESFNAVNRTITVVNAISSPTNNIELYPHRSTTSGIAIHKQVDDSVLINNGMQVVSGLRLRDRGQGHWHSPVQGDTHPTASGVGGGVLITRDSPIAGNFNIGSSIAKTIVSDTVNGSPRTGQFTRPRGLGVYFYEYVGRVIL
jgi:hypothetical protein